MWRAGSGAITAKLSPGLFQNVIAIVLSKQCALPANSDDKKLAFPETLLHFHVISGGHVTLS